MFREGKNYVVCIKQVKLTGLKIPDHIQFTRYLHSDVKGHSVKFGDISQASMYSTSAAAISSLKSAMRYLISEIDLYDFNTLGIQEVKASFSDVTAVDTEKIRNGFADTAMRRQLSAAIHKLEEAKDAIKNISNFNMPEYVPEYVEQLDSIQDSLTSELHRVNARISEVFEEKVE